MYKDKAYFDKIVSDLTSLEIKNLQESLTEHGIFDDSELLEDDYEDQIRTLEEAVEAFGNKVDELNHDLRQSEMERDLLERERDQALNQVEELNRELDFQRRSRR